MSKFKVGDMARYVSHSGTEYEVKIVKVRTEYYIRFPEGQEIYMPENLLESLPVETGAAQKEETLREGVDRIRRELRDDEVTIIELCNCDEPSTLTIDAKCQHCGKTV